MKTAAEIQSEIAQLSPGDFHILREWMGKPTLGKPARMWTSEELEEGARRMLEEPDPAKADEIWAEVVAGFYGEERA